jgi:hypothetical protein
MAMTDKAAAVASMAFIELLLEVVCPVPAQVRSFLNVGGNAAFTAQL